MGAGNYSKLVTVLTGQTITASERNNEHDNHINNSDFAGLDDYSPDITTMRIVTDPYPAGAESLPTSGSGELERLRYLIKQITGEAQWYVDPDSDITTIVSGTQVFTGAKSFSSAITISATTNQIVLGVTNTVTITSPAPAASRTYTIPDAGGAASFVMTEGTQTINGAKTFGSPIILPNSSGTTPSISGTDADTGINFPSGSTIAILANGVVAYLAVESGGAVTHQFAPNSTNAAIVNKNATTTGLGWNSSQLKLFSNNVAGLTLAESGGACNVMPIGAGTSNFGDGTTYWADISYKTLTDRGCIPWCDDGVELLDGRRVSDLEALCSIQKHPTRKTPTGLPRLDYSTMPAHAFKTVEKEFANCPVRRDENGEAWVLIEPSDGEAKWVPAQDGTEMTMMFGVMIGAFKEVSAKLKSVELELADLKSK